uniref:Ribosomal protein S4 n=1 Tax=Strombidium cf. sulcatum TaxID=2793073 RepID=A0A7T0Q5A3_9SPIT|nr:ribosomal protein S4 [Strombidium cf. sulcatum]QPL15949.1 ribosomal protein S4 [Strombidium cf. sulcatum]
MERTKIKYSKKLKLKKENDFNIIKFESIASRYKNFLKNKKQQKYKISKLKYPYNNLKFSGRKPNLKSKGFKNRNYAKRNYYLQRKQNTTLKIKISRFYKPLARTILHSKYHKNYRVFKGRVDFMKSISTWKSTTLFFHRVVFYLFRKFLKYSKKTTNNYLNFIKTHLVLAHLSKLKHPLMFNKNLISKLINNIFTLTLRPSKSLNIIPSRKLLLLKTKMNWKYKKNWIKKTSYLFDSVSNLNKKKLYSTYKNSQIFNNLKTHKCFTYRVRRKFIKPFSYLNRNNLTNVSYFGDRYSYYAQYKFFLNYSRILNFNYRIFFKLPRFKHHFWNKRRLLKFRGKYLKFYLINSPHKKIKKSLLIKDSPNKMEKGGLLITKFSDFNIFTKTKTNSTFSYWSNYNYWSYLQPNFLNFNYNQVLMYFSINNSFYNLKTRLMNNVPNRVQMPLFFGKYPYSSVTNLTDRTNKNLIYFKPYSLRKKIIFSKLYRLRNYVLRKVNFKKAKNIKLDTSEFKYLLIPKTNSTRKLKINKQTTSKFFKQYYSYLNTKKIKQSKILTRRNLIFIHPKIFYLLKKPSYNNYIKSFSKLNVKNNYALRRPGTWKIPTITSSISRNSKNIKYIFKENTRNHYTKSLLSSKKYLPIRDRGLWPLRKIINELRKPGLRTSKKLYKLNWAYLLPRMDKRERDSIKSTFKFISQKRLRRLQKLTNSLWVQLKILKKWSKIQNFKTIDSRDIRSTFTLLNTIPKPENKNFKTYSKFNFRFEPKKFKKKFIFLGPLNIYNMPFSHKKLILKQDLLTTKLFLRGKNFKNSKFKKSKNFKRYKFYKKRKLLKLHINPYNVQKFPMSGYNNLLQSKFLNILPQNNMFLGNYRTSTNFSSMYATKKKSLTEFKLLNDYTKLVNKYLFFRPNRVVKTHKHIILSSRHGNFRRNPSLHRFLKYSKIHNRLGCTVKNYKYKNYTKKKIKISRGLNFFYKKFYLNSGLRNLTLKSAYYNHSNLTKESNPYTQKILNNIPTALFSCPKYPSVPDFVYNILHNSNQNSLNLTKQLQLGFWKSMKKSKHLRKKLFRNRKLRESYNRFLIKSRILINNMSIRNSTKPNLKFVFNKKLPPVKQLRKVTFKKKFRKYRRSLRFKKRFRLKLRFSKRRKYKLYSKVKSRKGTYFRRKIYQNLRIELTSYYKKPADSVTLPLLNTFGGFEKLINLRKLKINYTSPVGTIESSYLKHTKINLHEFSYNFNLLRSLKFTKKIKFSNLNQNFLKPEFIKKKILIFSKNKYNKFTFLNKSMFLSFRSLPTFTSDFRLHKYKYKKRLYDFSYPNETCKNQFRKKKYLFFFRLINKRFLAIKKYKKYKNSTILKSYSRKILSYFAHKYFNSENTPFYNLTPSLFSDKISFNNPSAYTKPLLHFKNRNLFYENSIYNMSREVSVRRVRFKPGYQKIWRRARLGFKEYFNLKFIYQKQLTKYLRRYVRFSNSYRYATKETSALNIVMYSGLLPDKSSFNLFLSNKFIYVNGYFLKEETMSMFKNDLIQLSVTNQYYVYYKWLKNWTNQRRFRFKRLVYWKGRAHKYKIIKRRKQKSFYIPNWVYVIKFDFTDVKSYLEVDYFTLSAWVIYDPFLHYFNSPSELVDMKLTVYRIYNWKYIN